MKKLYLLIISLSIILILLVVARLTLQTNPPSPIPSHSPQPGTDTVSQALSDQIPFLVKPTGNQTEYYSGQQNSSNYTVYVGEGDLLAYFIDKDPKDFEFQTIDGYIQKYYQPDAERYGPWYDAANFHSYVFLQPGLVVVAHPTSKTVMEVWHIQPNLTISNFNLQYSTQFLVTPPPRNTQM